VLKTVLKATYQCKGHFNHYHSNKLIAQICHTLQARLPMSKIEFYYLKFFKPEILQKKIHALKGSNKRALLRRAKRGEALI
jgi:hypothetical protein